MSEARLPSGRIVKWNTQDAPTVYANLMAFGLSQFDIHVIFGEIGESTPTETTGIPRVKVILSPEQAVNLMKLLSVATESYASANGKIRDSGAVDVEQMKAQVQAQLDSQKKGLMDEGK